MKTLESIPSKKSITYWRNKFKAWQKEETYCLACHKFKPYHSAEDLCYDCEYKTLTPYDPSMSVDARLVELNTILYTKLIARLKHPWYKKWFYEFFIKMPHSKPIHWVYVQLYNRFKNGHTDYRHKFQRLLHFIYRRL